MDERGRDPVVESLVEPVEAVGLPPLGRARRADGEGQVEDQRQVGPQVAGGETVRLEQVGGGEPLPRTLVGQRRIDKAVAYHPVPRSERRADQAGDMVGAGRSHEQRLGRRAPAVGLALDDQRADRLRPRRAARLARLDDVDPVFAQGAREERRLGRLAGPFPALKGNEAPAHLPPRRAWKALAMRPNGPAAATASVATSGSRAVGRPGVVTTRSAMCWPLAIGALTGPS